MSPFHTKKSSTCPSPSLYLFLNGYKNALFLDFQARMSGLIRWEREMTRPRKKCDPYTRKNVRTKVSLFRVNQEAQRAAGLQEFMVLEELQLEDTVVFIGIFCHACKTGCRRPYISFTEQRLKIFQPFLRWHIQMKDIHHTHEKKISTRAT